MKKIALLLVSALLGANMLVSQTGQTVESLLKAKEKSDQDTADAKKKLKPATWEKRGDLFIEINQFLGKGLYQSMPIKGPTGAETVLAFTLGKPQSITPKGANSEEWIYERITLHFVDGKLESWDETKPIDPDALNKAYAAYKKAEELDPKGKFRTKTSVKQQITVLRLLFTTEAIKSYEAKKFPKAIELLENALELNQYPKMSTDTCFYIYNPAITAGMATYYVGMFAQEDKNYEKAEKSYNTCIEKKYANENPYVALAGLYREQAKPDKELDIIQKGIKLFPNSKELLVASINYYMSSGQTEAALEKLAQGIKDNPENQTFYYATGIMYDAMERDSTNKYTAAQKLEYHNLAITNYKKAVEIKPDYFDALYNLAVMYYNEAAILTKAANNLPLNKNKEFEALMIQSNEKFKETMPYMERASAVKPNDRTTLQNLLNIYRKLQMIDKQKATQEKIDNLPAEGGEGL